MNNLTSVLLNKDANENFQESLKQSQRFNFEDGTAQTIGYKSVPSLIIDLNYRNISQEDYNAIESAYQSNHSNTFLMNFGENIDPRINYSRLNNGVFVFGDYRFSTSINQMNASEKRYSGKISLITSTIFNYNEFSNIFNEPSQYIPNTTENTDFTAVLSEINPQSVEYGYELNRRFSNLGQSVSTQIDLGNNKKKWKLRFICEESDWLLLITFFRKKGGIGLFGMPLEGYYFSNNQQLINASFEQDSFKHAKLIGGVYQIEFNIIEVK